MNDDVQKMTILEIQNELVILTDGKVNFELGIGDSLDDLK